MFMIFNLILFSYFNIIISINIMENYVVGKHFFLIKTKFL